MNEKNLNRIEHRSKPGKIALFFITVALFGFQTMLISGGNKVKNLEKTTLGAGCFWCVEAVFDRIDGVVDVVAGYSGGTVANPSYQHVCTGTTGHAEVAQITYDADKLSYTELLDVFWKAHDPTTLNRQGADVGTQYRSAIFYHNESQNLKAEESKGEISESGVFGEKIVTEIVPLEEFYAAENYHQDYFENNPDASYCRLVIRPKLRKLKLK